MIRFGPGGNSYSFTNEGYKSSLDAPAWLSAKGLRAYEYQCTRGVNITEAFCKALKSQAERYDVMLSIHAPYYINLASTEEKIRQSSTRHLINSLQAADWMGAKAVVVHPGTLGKETREIALKNALTLLDEILNLALERDLNHIIIRPETMGKNNHLGTVEDVIAICKLNPIIIKPTIDFGHLHALTQGGMNNAEKFRRIIDKIANHLGDEVAKNLHIHFSPIEYTKGGEKKHHTLAEKEYGPDFAYLAEVILSENLTPTIICESAGTQAEDAVTFMNIYKSYGGKI